MARHSHPGDVVGAAFGGSGTTCLAANLEGRRSIYIDRDGIQGRAILSRFRDVQMSIMAEHQMEVGRLAHDKSYIHTLKRRRWLCPTSTEPRPIISATEELRVKFLDELESHKRRMEQRLAAGEDPLLDNYKKLFDTVITDAFGRTKIGASATGDKKWLLKRIPTQPKGSEDEVQSLFE